MLAVMFFLTAVSGCGKAVTPHSPLLTPHSPFFSFRDIPGVTAEEIAAIEALKRERESFIYGVMVSTEAFQDQVGDSGDYVVKGYVTLLCRWLTELFGIQFIPVIYDWIDILPGLESYTIDFNGDYTPTEDRRKKWFMTDGIAEHMVKYMRLAGSTDLSLIRKTRLLRFAFLEGSNTSVEVTSRSAFPFEAVTVKDSSEAYAMLKSDEIDAFIEDGFMEAAFDAFGEVVTEDFYPLIFNAVAMTTMNPTLKPVISVVTKALRNGAIHYLNHLYNQGYEEYKITKFHSQLTKEERAYLQNPSPVPLAARYYNYPMAFYNSFEKKWEGIAFDVLSEVTKFTGLTFQIANNEKAEFDALLEMLETGRVHMLPDLPYSSTLEGRFLWSKNNFLSNQYALLSKVGYPNISLNEISNANVGLVANTASAEMFHSWFPVASNIREYATDSSAFLAMDNGEVDLLMATKNRLLSILNYYELPNYKANYLFNDSESSFAFNRNQGVLQSVFDKALPLIDTKTIVEQWMTKTYDYRTKVAEGRLPWFIGAAVLFLIVLAMILIQFIRGMGTRKRLSQLVAEKTATLSAASAEAMKAYAEAETASVEAINASLAKSRFLANMSHEMRTPMNVIVGLTDLMLEDDNVSWKVKEDLKKINSAGTTLTGLINDILDISKIEAGKQELNPA
jgi:ABC-type amino acid transport substrate-binding protein